MNSYGAVMTWGIVRFLPLLMVLQAFACAGPQSQQPDSEITSPAPAPSPLEAPKLEMPPPPPERTSAEMWEEVGRRMRTIAPQIREDIATVRAGEIPPEVLASELRREEPDAESEARSITGFAGIADAGGVTFPEVDVRATYTTENGLPSNRITAIFVDEEDAWIGTADQGVARLNFAEKNWLVTRTEDGLASNRVTDIVKYKDRIFVGTQEGVSIWDGLAWTTLAEVDRVQLLNTVMLERDGVLWVASRAMRGGLVTFDGEVWKDRSTLRRGTVLNNVSDFAFQGLEMWIGTTNRGVYHFDGTGWSTDTVAQGIASNFVYTLVATPTKCMLGGCCGLSVYEDGEWIIYDIAEGLPHSTVNTMAANGELVWIGSKNGLAMFDGLDFVVFRENQGLVDNRITSLFVHGDEVWVGTADGLNVLDTGY